jgi:hypothetical protein
MVSGGEAMTDYPFYKGVPPHQRQSDTSRAAAISKLETANTERAKVYRHIRQQGSYGATDEEIADAIGDPTRNTAGPRRRELVIAEVVEDSGQRRQTRRGRQATVWVAVAREPQQERLF